MEEQKIKLKKCQYPGCENEFSPRSNRQKYCEKHLKTINYERKTQEITQKSEEKVVKDNKITDKITDIIIRGTGGLEITIKIN